jgi:hypothetical protein
MNPGPFSLLLFLCGQIEAMAFDHIVAELGNGILKVVKQFGIAMVRFGNVAFQSPF